MVAACGEGLRDGVAASHLVLLPGTQKELDEVSPAGCRVIKDSFVRSTREIVLGPLCRG